MIHYFTNREISIKLDINLARWKRWSRSFLPPDPLGGLQSGYARQYVFKDLFKVFLGGHLLSHLKLSIPDAQKVLADLAPWLKKAGFLELNGSVEKLKAKAGLDNPLSDLFARFNVGKRQKSNRFWVLDPQNHRHPTGAGGQPTSHANHRGDHSQLRYARWKNLSSDAGCSTDQPQCPV